MLGGLGGLELSDDDGGGGSGSGSECDASGVTKQDESNKLRVVAPGWFLSQRAELMLKDTFTEEDADEERRIRNAATAKEDSSAEDAVVAIAAANQGKRLDKADYNAVKSRQLTLEQRFTYLYSRRRYQECADGISDMLASSWCRQYTAGLVRNRLSGMYARCLMKLGRHREAIPEWIDNVSPLATEALDHWEALGECCWQCLSAERKSDDEDEVFRIGVWALETLVARHAISAFSWHQLGRMYALRADQSESLRVRAALCFFVALVRSSPWSEYVSKKHTLSYERFLKCHHDSVAECVRLARVESLDDPMAVYVALTDALEPSKSVPPKMYPMPGQRYDVATWKRYTEAAHAGEARGWFYHYYLRPAARHCSSFSNNKSSHDNDDDADDDDADDDDGNARNL